MPHPHKAIWCLIPVFLMIGYFFSHRTLDIMYHATILVIGAFHLSIFFSIVLAIIGFVYWLNRHKKLIPWMTFMHVGWTILVFGFLLTSAVFRFSGIFMKHGFLLHWGYMLIFFTGVVQLLLFINVLRSKG